MGEEELRPEVRAFAIAMEARLRANDHKGGWKDCKPEWLLWRLDGELKELDLALLRGENILGEAADVANFAMMIADVTGVLGNADDRNGRIDSDKGATGK